MGAEDRKTIRILATSDHHGMFYPWDYLRGKECLDGSLAQVKTAVTERYDPENTLLVDAGDSIQDNSAELFYGDELHPMIMALNDIGYELWTAGNHDYDVSMAYLDRCIRGFTGKTVIGNVLDPSGDPIADRYAIIEKNGIRIAVISLITPLITKMLPDVLEGYTVLDTIEATEEILGLIEGKYDILVGVHHMGMRDDAGIPNSGIRTYAQHFPQYDLIISSHEHELIEGEIVNGIPVFQNLTKAQTMTDLTLTLESAGGRWKMTDLSSETVWLKDYAPDPGFMSRFRPYHERAIKENAKVIGRIDWGGQAESTVPPTDATCTQAESAVKPSHTQDRKGVLPALSAESPLVAGATALTDFLLEVVKYYTHADITSVPITHLDACLPAHEIHLSDISNMFRFTSTLYTFRMTGRQLRILMEKSASYYQTRQKGDTQIRSNPTHKCFTNYVFGGISYGIDIDREAGHRICDLRKPDGEPVADTDEFTVSVFDYCAKVLVMSPGALYDKDDMPELISSNVRADIGTFADMIIDYITNVKHGVIRPFCSNRWKVVYRKD